MPISLSGRNYLKLLDFTPDEIRYLISLAKQFKALKLAGTPHRYLEGKNIVLLFEKTSTRTRCSFEVAGHDLGLGVTYLDPGSSQMGNRLKTLHACLAACSTASSTVVTVRISSRTSLLMRASLSGTA